MAVNVMDRFQVFAPQTRANPQAVYEKIRQEEPI
jgi:hypothetical protein